MNGGDVVNTVLVMMASDGDELWHPVAVFAEEPTPLRALRTWVAWERSAACPWRDSYGDGTRVRWEETNRQPWTFERVPVHPQGAER